MSCPAPLEWDSCRNTCDHANAACKAIYEIGHKDANAAIGGAIGGAIFGGGVVIVAAGTMIAAGVGGSVAAALDY